VRLLERHDDREQGCENPEDRAMSLHRRVSSIQDLAATIATNAPCRTEPSTAACRAVRGNDFIIDRADRELGHRVQNRLPE
jgi:hypothetical protein